MRVDAGLQEVDNAEFQAVLRVRFQFHTLF